MAHITLLSQIARGAGCVAIGRNGSADKMLASDWSRLVAGVQPVSGSKRTSGGRRGRLLGDWSRCILTYPKPFNWGYVGYVGYMKGHMIIYLGYMGYIINNK